MCRVGHEKNVDEITKKKVHWHTKYEVRNISQRAMANNVDKLHRRFVANVRLFNFLPHSIRSIFVELKYENHDS